MSGQVFLSIGAASGLCRVLCHSRPLAHDSAGLTKNWWLKKSLVVIDYWHRGNVFSPPTQTINCVLLFLQLKLLFHYTHWVCTYSATVFLLRTTLGWKRGGYKRRHKLYMKKLFKSALCDAAWAGILHTMDTDYSITNNGILIFYSLRVHVPLFSRHF